jgi:hypothetical protein
MVVSPDHRMLFTAGNDGTIFIFNISEQMYNTKDQSLKPVICLDIETQNDKKGNRDVRSKIVDPELADIVYVKKDQMEEWKSSQDMLKYQLALTKKRIEIKLEDQKKKFNRQYEEIRKQKELDINDLKKRYDDLTKQKQL